MKTLKYIYIVLGIFLISFTACDTILENPPTPQERIDTTSYTFSESFKSNLGNFTQFSVSGTENWKASDYQYAIMTGNSENGVSANEDWLISPELTLPSALTSVFTFDYVTRGFSNLSAEASIWVSENYVKGSNPTTAIWTQVSPVEPIVDAQDWNMTNAGDISLKAFMGKKISIAFKYVSTSGQAGTWQIKNFVVKDKIPVKLPYFESFNSTKGKFTAVNVSGNQYWYFHNDGYLTITGYINGVYNANEDWLISPQIDMTTITNAKLTFDHVTRYFGNLKTDATVWVSENYEEGMPSTATWTQLQTVPFSDPGSWPTVFPSSREISLSAYAGKKISIAFKYLATSSKAGTWEIKNFNVQEGEAVVEDFGKGTEVAPYNIAGGILYQGNSAWVKAYIVGYIVFGTPTTYVFSSDTCTVNSNILIAASKTETDVNKCMAVQLPAGAVQTGLNLKTVKTNIGKEVTLYGSLEAYFGKPGLKSVSYYVLEGGTTGGTKPIVVDFTVPEITIANLRTQWTGVVKTITDKKKIVGIVITDLIGGNSTSLKNLTIASVDNSAGIIIRLLANGSYNLGEKVEVSLEGLELNHFGQALQLNNVPANRIQVIGTGTISPRVTTIADVNANYASFESTLVTVNGTVTSPNGLWGGAQHQTNTLTNGVSNISLFVSSFSSFKSTAIPVGEKAITGIIGQNTTNISSPVYQLIVRNLNDIKN